MPLSSYCQSLDSSLLRELNDEFLKGIQAREKVVVLNKIIKTDSQTIALYKDSIVPTLNKAVEISKEEIINLNGIIDQKNRIIKAYRYGSIGLSILLIGLLI